MTPIKQIHRRLSRLLACVISCRFVCAILECVVPPLGFVGTYFHPPLFRRTIACGITLYICLIFLLVIQSGIKSFNGINISNEQFSEILPKLNDSFVISSTDSSFTNGQITRNIYHASTETSNTPLSEESHGNISSVVHYDFLSEDFIIEEEPVKKWINERVTLCDGDFVGYGDNFAHLKCALIDPGKSIGNKGGENINEVFNQSEKSEFLKLQNGYFKIICPVKPIYKFSRRSALRDWNGVLENRDDFKSGRKFALMSKFTIALQRYEYANLYHTITDWYNTFLMLIVFKQNPSNLNILWIDGHPKGGLDDVWEVLFGSVLRAGQLQLPVLFRDLVWGLRQSVSLMNIHSLQSVPYVEEFRTFFLKQHKIIEDRELNCERLSVLFIWRRDYIAHPRNPSGKVSRKIQNEEELVNAIKETFPDTDVKGIQTDNYTMSEQLESIVNTDILIGMHGAGLSLSLFLPKHSGLIEFYPKYWSTTSKHFKAMARWRRIHYIRWVNKDRKNEYPNQKTRIPTEIITSLVEKMRGNICGKMGSK